MTFPQIALRSALFGFIAAAVPISFSGTAAGTQFTVNPGILHFGEVVVGTTETLPANVVNAGSTTVTVSSITSSQTTYTVKHPSLPVTLSPGGSMAISIAFKPGAMGSVSGEIAINGSSASLKVTGTGQSSQGLYATPASIVFGNVPVGSSASSSVAITNGRNSSVTIGKAVTNNSELSVEGLSLPLTLTPGQSFTFKIAFSPTSSGTVWGQFGAQNASGHGLVEIILNGTGTASSGLSASPASLSFGNVTVGSNESKSGTLTAAGSSVTVNADATTSSEFTVSGISLPATIPAGKSASYNVTFAPQMSGAASGTLTFKTVTAGITAIESVSGTGVSQQSHSVDLNWDPSSSQVSGYNIYRGATSGGPYSKVNSTLDGNTSYVDSTVLGSQTYYYVTTAVNSSGQESTYSNQVQVVIP